MSDEPKRIEGGRIMGVTLTTGSEADGVYPLTEVEASEPIDLILPRAALAEREPMCDHRCLLDDGHVERGESHFYGYLIEPDPEIELESLRLKVMSAKDAAERLLGELRIAPNRPRGGRLEAAEVAMRAALDNPQPPTNTAEYDIDRLCDMYRHEMRRSLASWRSAHPEADGTERLVLRRHYEWDGYDVLTAEEYEEER